MDTVDKVAEVKRPGRPKKQDSPSVMGQEIARQAKESRSRKSKKENQVVNKWYEMRGTKLSLCKEIASGTVFRTLVGTTDDKLHGKEVLSFIKKLEGEGRLKVRV